MPQRIQLRRGTASEWNLANPVLEAGELGLEQSVDGVKIKVGDGVSTWAELDYFATDTATALTAADVLFVPVGTIGSTDLQTALAEVASEGSAALAAESSARISEDDDEALARIAGDEAEAAARGAAIAALSDTYVPIAGAATTVDTAIDFTTAPTINGEPIGAGAAGPLAVTVPYWDHAEPACIYHGAMIPTGVDMGPLDVEAWVRHDTGAEYLLSEGHGGSHWPLMGFAGGAPSGNVWNGTTTTSFTGAYTAQDGEWLHYRLQWDGATLWCLINGIVVCSVPFAGPGRAQFGSWLVGGSDHSNWMGCVAQLRAWVGQVGVASPWLAFNAALTERHFSDRINSTGTLAQFVANYLGPGPTYPDLGDGFAGELHPGVSRGVFYGIGYESLAPHPQRVVDATAPFGNQMNVARTRSFAAPVAAPVGAKIWDSFGRADSIWAFTDYPTMGSTEAGSLGVKAWGHTLGTWGVFDGAAICGTQNLFARVANDSADMDVRVQRLVDTTHGFSYCSAAVRITADRVSGWVAKVYKDDTGTYAVLVRPNGTTAGSWLTSGTWTHLRLVASGTTFTVYVLELGLGGWTNLGNVTGETANQAEVGAGLYHDFAVGSQARYLDFEVR